MTCADTATDFKGCMIVRKGLEGETRKTVERPPFELIRLLLLLHVPVGCNLAVGLSFATFMTCGLSARVSDLWFVGGSDTHRSVRGRERKLLLYCWGCVVKDALGFENCENNHLFQFLSLG